MAAKKISNRKKVSNKFESNVNCSNVDIDGFTSIHVLFSVVIALLVILSALKSSGLND